MSAARTQNNGQPGSRGWLPVVIILILFGGGTFLPAVGFLVGLAWTLPVTLLVYRYNVPAGTLTLLVACLLFWRVAGEAHLILPALVYGGVGVLYGYFFRVGMAPQKAVLRGALLAILTFVPIFFLTAPPVAVVWRDWQTGLEASQGSVLELYRQSGVLDILYRQGISPEALSQSLAEVTELLTSLLPALLILEVIFTVVLTYFAAYWVLRRLQARVVTLPPFREWQLPWYLVWGVVLGLALALLGDYLGLNILTVIGQNLVFFYIPWLVVVGLAVIAYFDYLFSVALIVKVFFAIIAILNFPLMVILVAVLGAFEPLVNFRKLIDKTPKGD